MRFFLSLSFFVLFAFFPGSFAHALSTDLKDIPSGLYVLDPEHASITFRIAHFGTSYYTGRFDRFGATLDFDSRNPERSLLTVNIFPASLDTNNPTLEKELTGSENFNIDRYRRMSFVSIETKRTGVNTGKVEGNFTMLGKTRPVTLNVTFNGWTMHFLKKIPVLGFSATGSLKRSDFGFTNFLPAVGDVVTFQVEAEFDKLPDETRSETP